MSDTQEINLITGTKVRLRPKTIEDARHDYNWQKDPELASLDATMPLRCTFEEYYADYLSELRHPYAGRYSFSVETLKGRHIGNCVYYNVDHFRSEAEIGIMIGNRKYWNRGYGTDAVTLLVDHIFRKEKFFRIYLKTLVNNNRAQQCFRKCCFEPCGYLDGNGYRFMLMETHRFQWENLAENILPD